jgi:hypothetical protein
MQQDGNDTNHPQLNTGQLRKRRRQDAPHAEPMKQRPANYGAVEDEDRRPSWRECGRQASCKPSYHPERSK